LSYTHSESFKTCKISFSKKHQTELLMIVFWLKEKSQFRHRKLSMQRIVFCRHVIDIMSSSNVILIADINTHVSSARSRIISSRNARSMKNNREIEKNRWDEIKMRMRSREKNHDSRFSTRWNEFLILFFYMLIDEVFLRDLDTLKSNDWSDMLRNHSDVTYTRIIFSIIQCDAKIEYMSSF
jgi:hypothetical protein